MASDIFSSVFELEAKPGTAWPNIRAAKDRTVDLHTRLAAGIGDGIDADASVVVFGSAGRYEVTDGSDTDWTYLVDGQAQTTYQAEALNLHYSRVSEFLLVQTPPRVSDADCDH
jgi:hypothetical protein